MNGPGETTLLRISEAKWASRNGRTLSMFRRATTRRKFGSKGKKAGGKADDVAFIGKLLDDLGTVVKADEKRVYACGMSNGAMMCYRLALR